MPIHSFTTARTLARRLVCLAFALATLGVLPASPAHAQGQETLAALRSYRLTMPTLRKVFGAWREARREVGRGRDAAAVDAYFRPDPMSRRSIAEVTAFVDRHAAIRRAVARNGLSSREFATAYLSYLHATRYLAEEAAAQYLKRRVPGPPGHVPRQNVELIRSSGDELERLVGGR